MQLSGSQNLCFCSRVNWCCKNLCILMCSYSGVFKNHWSRLLRGQHEACFSSHKSSSSMDSGAMSYHILMFNLDFRV